ncbi:unnamed protein product [Mytilus coruscus]|uniref:Uncharacterized protein n=1 Tax=Mytilus coruscus TaxID=42192 RepID=A0A6J8AU42_MYTCO|nr:unnamed protein product [Mytilus coruscus]
MYQIKIFLLNSQTVDCHLESQIPSLRQLLNEEPPPECIVPSDQLFSKYLQDLSPVNSPDNFSIDIDLEPQEPSITLHNSEPSPPVSIATIIDQQQPSPSLSVATSINHQEPTEQILDLTMTRTITPCTPEDPITTNQEEPLDLSMKLKPANNLNIKPKEIPTNSLTPVIDCLVPTNLWNVKPISLKTDNHEHLCLDPRLFFAGAPSQYHTHLLANTLQEKVNLCRTSQKARYKKTACSNWC